MAHATYPKRAHTSPEKDLLSPPRTPIPKSYEADLRPLVFLKGESLHLASEDAFVGLLMAGTVDGTNVEECVITGYERQLLRLQPRPPGKPATNIEPVVFRFPTQPQTTIPLVGVFVGDRLRMRGALRPLIGPQEGGPELNAPQVRIPADRLRLAFS